jgi:hypothetical protein
LSVINRSLEQIRLGSQVQGPVYLDTPLEQ